MNQVTVENYRCLREPQHARLAPLTLLVGDNSTGKTSFLALVRALWDTAFGDGLPDFKDDPYDLGSFDEIASSGGSPNGSTAAFTAGFRVPTPSASPRRTPNPPAFGFRAEFVKKASAPFPMTRRLEGASHWIESSMRSDRHRLKFGNLRDGTDIASNHVQRLWRNQDGSSFMPLGIVPSALRYALFAERGRSQVPEADRKGLLRLSRSLRTNVRRPFASAPVRSRPRRSYDPAAPRRDSEGDYVPMYLAHVLRTDRSRWQELKQAIDDFGRRAGLFEAIRVRQLGKHDGDPFQIQVQRLASEPTAHFHNLVDVGYGVSQVLPIVTELFRSRGNQILLLQQPEVHLHPSAQAALGSLFCQAAAEGRQLIVETHSDHLIDRVRMDIRDSATKLRPDDVSLLFFERRRFDVRIHSLRFDDNGNLDGAPDGYRRFFMEETRRSIGLD